MIAKVQKWGNSLALRIPKAFAADAHLKNESSVEISLVEGRIVVEPVVIPEWNLEKLLKGVNRENIHHEINTGPAMGREVW
jgi:antitoxin MazE